MSPPRPWNAEVARSLIDAEESQEGALLPILHRLQHAFGCVPDEAVPLVAEALNISRAEVHGVVTFYHDFRRQPAGRRVVKLCQAEACQARGGRAVTAAALAEAGVALGGTTADGELTVEAVYCLGLCASGPAALVDGQPVARLNEAGAAALVSGEMA